MPKKFKWYEPTRAKSYDKFLNFILGGRGIGKTYDLKKTQLKDSKQRENSFSISKDIKPTCKI